MRWMLSSQLYLGKKARRIGSFYGLAPYFTPRIEQYVNRPKLYIHSSISQVSSFTNKSNVQLEVVVLPLISSV